MKRERSPIDNGIRPVFPLLFWRDCLICGMLFRWEKGWQKIAWCHAGTIAGYVCNSCCPTAGDAERALRNV